MNSLRHRTPECSGSRCFEGVECLLSSILGGDTCLLSSRTVPLHCFPLRGPPAGTSIAWRFSGDSTEVTPLTLVFHKTPASTLLCPLSLSPSSVLIYVYLFFLFYLFIYFSFILSQLQKIKNNDNKYFILFFAFFSKNCRVELCFQCRNEFCMPKYPHNRIFMGFAE